MIILLLSTYGFVVVFARLVRWSAAFSFCFHETGLKEIQTIVGTIDTRDLDVIFVLQLLFDVLHKINAFEVASGHHFFKKSLLL